ncbi:hypothetical protein DYB37_008754 [Aphanomyces astaci]|uniref:DDE-1 domain-containing protein n=1 Tax=Aphanomyces astaci TaxID=112090 RepID=A0A418FJ84_APHAT|nr:hypothetical protein DYB37_008754 [Aphanomyces astaci]
MTPFLLPCVAAETRSRHMMQLVKRNLKEWLFAYLQSKKIDAVAFNIFRSLLSQFVQRHRFRHSTPRVNKVTQTVLDEAWLGYTASFWVKFVDRSQILNVDETAVYFNMPGTDENAWMDERVWSIYVDALFGQHIEDASMLVLDNLDYHVSDESHDKVAEKLSQRH